MDHGGIFNEELASRVARLKDSTGLSIDRIAELALLERDQVERILAGTEQVGMDTVILLAGALGVETGELLKGIVWVPDCEGGGGEYRVDHPEGG